MLLRSFLMTAAMLAFAPVLASAQSASEAGALLKLELNTVQDVEGACRLTFVAENQTGFQIEQAVFETVIFDTSGGVARLSLFDFRDLPTDRPRVRQFDLPDITCDNVGQALINGSNTCTVEGASSDICTSALMLSSRLPVELLG